MKTTHVENALEEMEYEIVDNSFGMTMPVSKPAQLAFAEPATVDYDRIEAELEKKGLSSFEEHSGGDSRYCHFGVIGREYKRIVVKMWPTKARVYPRENSPSLVELAQITSAIERACGATLEHSPIEGDSDE